MNHGLSDKNVQKIKEIIIEVCPHFEKVGLFGSRATGNYKSYSDIDLVLYGNITDRENDRLYTNFMESNIPYSVDTAVYNHVSFPPLKRHIDKNVVTLFTK